MTLAMHTISRPKALKGKRKRAGRGKGTGRGTYSGKGLKGQRARSGGRRGIARRSAFTQFLMRTPKLKGFKRTSIPVATISIGTLGEYFKDNEVVSQKTLTEKSLIRKSARRIKILGNGSLSKSLVVHAHAFSKTAHEAIIAAGGTCVVITTATKARSKKQI